MREHYDLSQMRGIKNPYLRHLQRPGTAHFGNGSGACIDRQLEENPSEEEGSTRQQDEDNPSPSATADNR